MGENLKGGLFMKSLFNIKNLLLTNILLVALFITACGSSDEEPATSNQEKESDTENTNSSDEVVNLRFAMWTGTPEEQEIWEELASRVNEVHPNIEVEFETDSFQNYWDKLQAQVASGTAADILALQSLRTGAFGYRDVYEPLDEFIDSDQDFNIDDFDTSILESLSWDGEQIAIPYDFGPYMLYYNKDIFDEKGVEYPTPNMSWDEFLEKAKAVTGEETYGFTMDTRQFNNNIPWIWQNGGDFMNEDGSESLMNEPETVDAIQFISDMFHESGVMAPISDPGNTTLYREQFYDGLAAMYLDGPWNTANVRAQADFEWDYTTVPAGEAGAQTFVAGSGFGIFSGSEHKEEAWKAISVMLGEENFKYLASTGRAYPARTSAVDSFINASEEPESIELVSEAAKAARPLVTTTNWQEADKMMVRELDRIWFNNEPVEDVLEDIDEEFQELLDEHQETISE